MGIVCPFCSVKNIFNCSLALIQRTLPAPKLRQAGVAMTCNLLLLRQPIGRQTGKAWQEWTTPGLGHFTRMKAVRVNGDNYFSFFLQLKKETKKTAANDRFSEYLRKIYYRVIQAALYEADDFILLHGSRVRGSLTRPIYT